MLKRLDAEPRAEDNGLLLPPTLCLDDGTPEGEEGSE